MPPVPDSGTLYTKHGMPLLDDCSVLQNRLPKWSKCTHVTLDAVKVGSVPKMAKSKDTDCKDTMHHDGTTCVLYAKLHYAFFMTCGKTFVAI